MKLSTKARYGLRAMMCLALAENGKVTMARVISEKEGLPLSYLEQLFAMLKRGGLVRSLKGPSGGYALARPAKEISLAEVITALEGRICIASCEDVAICRPHPASCALKEILDGANEALLAYFQEMTLADFAEIQLEKTAATLRAAEVSH
ncbi:MAG: Rrf2 family transcriptional regulator [Synergistaceae bacterium]|nr:Rrf2 family transcriptional regulator [Synergistaceae bacterium]